MTTTKRFYKTAAVTSAIGLLIAGCGGGGSDGEVGANAQEEDIQLRMTVWTANEEHLELFNGIAEEYMAENPEVTGITFDSLPFEDYDTTLTTQAAGGNAPDIAWMGGITQDLLDAEALVPLTESFQNTEGWEYDDLIESTTEQFSRDGELYAYPFSNSPFAIFVNNDLLNEAGQSVDPANLTWEQVISAGSAVQDQTGNAGLVIQDFNYSHWPFLETIWMGWDAAPWSEDGTQCTFNSDEMASAFEFIHGGIFDQNAMPGPGTSVDFFAGDAGFVITQVSRAALLDGSFDFDVYPLPDGPAGDYATFGQAGMGVLQSSQNPQAAVDFLAYLTNPENSAQLAEYFPPPRESLVTAEQLAEVNETLTAEQLQAVVVDQLPEAETDVVHSNLTQIISTVNAELDAMWQPDADVPAVLDSVCTSLQPLLEQE